MITSPSGIAALQRRERCRLTAYQGADDPPDVWTIGWGHSSRLDPSVREGLVWTQLQCDQQLALDLHVFEGAVMRQLGSAAAALDQNMFDALVSFVYNEGEGTFAASTMLRLIKAGFPSSGWKRAAAIQFCRFTLSRGVHSDGLAIRRADEMLQFMGL